MKPILSQNDFYTKKAKAELYPARSVYKLKEMDVRFKLFHPGDRVLDLGASPGSWLMYLSRQVGPDGRVVALDILDLRISCPANTVFLKMDILSEDIFNLPEFQTEYTAVVSDLAPQTSGIKFQDEARSLELVQKAWEIAQQVLKKDGCFVAKIFESPQLHSWLNTLKGHFRSVKLYHPLAVRKHSKEVYLVALKRI